jgi:hypothetical protein
MSLFLLVMGYVLRYLKESEARLRQEKKHDPSLPCSLEPDLDLVAIRIGDVSVGEAGSELATTEQAPSGAFDLGDGTVNVVGVHEPKAEMCNAAIETGGGGVLCEGDDVVPTGRLSVDESVSSPVLAQTKDLLVEPQGRPRSRTARLMCVRP